MKGFSAVSLAVFAVVAVSVCGALNNGTCGRLDAECTENGDCCSQNCRRSITLFKKYCKVPVVNQVLGIAMRGGIHEVQKGKCEYRKPVNRTLSRTVYKKIGFNAANPYLAVGTYVQVKYNDDKIIVKVTDQPMNSNDVLLNLSEESARELGIEDEGLYECTTQVPVWENCFFLRNIWYFGPIISLIGFVALNLSPA